MVLTILNIHQLVNNTIHVNVNNQVRIPGFIRIVKKTLYINKIEQVRLLADPLKLQLLQAFAEGEKTAKEAAESLGESLTKLYRHVDALLDGGLIEITQETPKRGTVERTFRAVAERFEVDQSLFSGGNSFFSIPNSLVRF